MDGGEKVVFAARKDVVVHGDARRDKLCDSAFDEFLGELGILELLTDGYALAGAYKFGKVCVEGMMRKAGELYVLCVAVGAACEGDAQDFGSLDGVVRECFVEVAHAEQQDGIGMFLFHLDILLHQRRLDNFLCHSLFSFC